MKVIAKKKNKKAEKKEVKNMRGKGATKKVQDWRKGERQTGKKKCLRVTNTETKVNRPSAKRKIHRAPQILPIKVGETFR